MSDNRTRCLDTMRKTNNVIFLTPESLPEWLDPAIPLHPSFELLSPIHRSDYLRCYFMHVHGGGYADIKETHVSWAPYFEQLANSTLYGIGYPEIRGGIADVRTCHINGSYYLLSQKTNLRINTLANNFFKVFRMRLIGLGAFIFKPNTKFTQAWFDELSRRMDLLTPLLQETPGKQPKELAGEVYDGAVSTYPVPWSFILGTILVPMMIRYGNLGRSLPKPSFENYE